MGFFLKIITQPSSLSHAPLSLFSLFSLNLPDKQKRKNNNNNSHFVGSSPSLTILINHNNKKTTYNGRLQPRRVGPCKNNNRREQKSDPFSLLSHRSSPHQRRAQKPPPFVFISFVRHSVWGWQEACSIFIKSHGFGLCTEMLNPVIFCSILI